MADDNSKASAALVPSKVFSNDLFGSVRTLVENNKYWFSIRDACDALHYSNPTVAMKRFCLEKGIKRFSVETAGGKQTVIFIDESNLLRLVVGSSTVDSQRFEAWIFDEVLPAIRSSGVFMTSAAQYDYYNDPALFNERLNRMEDQLVDARIANERLLQENSSLNAQLLEANNKLIDKEHQIHMMLPARAFYDYYYKDNNRAEVATYYANLLGVGPMRFNQILVSFGVLREKVTKTGNLHRYAIGYWAKYIKPVVSTFTVTLDSKKTKSLRVQSNPSSPSWLRPFYPDLLAMLRKYDMLDEDSKFRESKWEKARKLEMKRYKKLGKEFPQAWAKSFFDREILFEVK